MKIYLGNSYADEVADLRKLMENDLLQKANTLFTNKNFKEAEMAFANLHEVVPADAEYLYYAAVSAVSGQDFDAALKHYLKLKELGYTGVKTEYFAINKETGEEEVFDKATRDLYVKTIKSHIAPGERDTKSKAPEITKNIAFIYLQQDKMDEALTAIKEARATDPLNSDLVITEANIYYKLGDTQEYERLIKEATARDPENKDLLFNLGVLSSKAGKKEEAKKYYLKVVSLDSNNVNALTNLAVLILDEDKAIVEEMNGLGNSSADNQRYDELIAKRKIVYKEAIPYLEKVVNSGNADADVARTLMNIYSAVGEAAKAKEIKVNFNL
ncbi:tetratricopeptide repeat protein [Lacinutrix neustonica]|uniref:Tetratricopeptide repeat protein n=1 Tax=Lacinutrix neustonica TaxID=2980107 RepID=A0A9E8MXH6_9FLAO|nr:tetratricopeptide repeat protein [Lacinutrix neustonica]WAC02821.1 tetratricopeptide repeat protein [Lacinutrix neustonica]